MQIQRFSAVGNFGVLIDDVERLKDGAGILSLLGEYDIEGQDIPVDTIDITPYYWRRPAFRYMMTRNSLVSPVEVEMLPTHNESESYIPVGNFVISGMRKVTVPTDQEMMAIIGPGPRFPGKICIHELVFGE